MALQHGETALRLNPRDPLFYRVHNGMMWAFAFERDWDKVVACIDRVRPFINQVQAFRVMEMTALVNLGCLERARAMAERMLALDPGFTVSRWCENRRRVHVMQSGVSLAGVYERLQDALLAAGVPE